MAPRIVITEFTTWFLNAVDHGFCVGDEYIVNININYRNLIISHFGTRSNPTLGFQDAQDN